MEFILKVFLLVAFMTSAHLQSDSEQNDLESLLSQIFGAVPDEKAESSCQALQGDIQGCSVCYLCKDRVITRARNQGRPITPLNLTETTCKSSANLCCIADIFTSIRNNNDYKCGVANPNGRPRSRRRSPRTVLPGEYPWRATIYLKSRPSQPLCAANYIDYLNQYPRTLVAPASCVQGVDASRLAVAFTDQRLDVQQVVVHHLFNRTSSANDIALVNLFRPAAHTAPTWLEPVCLPETPVLAGSPCITVSDDSLFINTIVPRRQECVTSPPLLDSQLCALAPQRCHVPQHGAGLYCAVDEYLLPKSEAKRKHYALAGIAIRHEEDSTAVYTDVLHHTEWIKQMLVSSSM